MPSPVSTNTCSSSSLISFISKFKSLNYLCRVEMFEKLGMEQDENGYDGNGKNGLWDGKRFVEIKKDLFSELKLLSLVELFKLEYELQILERGERPFHSVEEWMSYGSMKSYIETSCLEKIRRVKLSRIEIFLNFFAGTLESICNLPGKIGSRS